MKRKRVRHAQVLPPVGPSFPLAKKRENGKNQSLKISRTVPTSQPRLASTALTHVNTENWWWPLMLGFITGPESPPSSAKTAFFFASARP